MMFTRKTDAQSESYKSLHLPTNFETLQFLVHMKEGHDYSRVEVDFICLPERSAWYLYAGCSGLPSQ